MQIWSHTHWRQGCGFALVTMAAVQAAVTWRANTLRRVVFEPLPPVRLIASPVDATVLKSMVIPAQFSGINPALRGISSAAKSHRLPPVGKTDVPQRLPPISPTRIARRLPPVPSDLEKLQQPTVPTPLKRDVGISGFAKSALPALQPATPKSATQEPDRAVGTSTAELKENKAVAVPEKKLSPPTPERKVDRLAPSDPLTLIPNPVQPDWQRDGTTLSVADRQAAQLVQGAAALARRGATFSARRELETALVVIAQALDSQYATTGFTKCLRSGLLALEEAGDFAPSHARGQLTLDVPLIVSRHRSGALSAKEAERCTPSEAAGSYHAFAQDHLVAACGGSAHAAHALFGLGKVYASMSEDTAKERRFSQRALVLHQAALKVDGTHPLAATELGTLLARSGRLQEAREVLTRGLSRTASPETWRQLANVHAQLGELELATQARAEGERIAQFSRQSHPDTVTAPNGMTVRWVDHATFQRAGQELMPNDIVPRAPLASPRAPAAPQVPKTAAQPRRTIRSW